MGKGTSEQMMLSRLIARENALSKGCIEVAQWCGTWKEVEEARKTQHPRIQLRAKGLYLDLVLDPTFTISTVGGDIGGWVARTSWDVVEKKRVNLSKKKTAPTTTGHKVTQKPDTTKAASEVVAGKDLHDQLEDMRPLSRPRTVEGMSVQDLKQVLGHAAGAGPGVRAPRTPGYVIRLDKPAPRKGVSLTKRSRELVRVECLSGCCTDELRS